MSALRIHPQDVLGHGRAQATGALYGVRLALSRLALGLAHRLATPPAPRQRSAYEEARELRELAQEVQRNDPRFAADLFAAADRHEQLYG